MLFQVLFICLFSNILLTECTENAFADVLLPKALSQDAYNVKLQDFWTSDRLKGATTRDITLPSFQSKTTSGDSNITTGPPSNVPGSSPSNDGTTNKAIFNNGLQVKTVGRVFWQVGTSYYSCSASVVTSKSNDLIATAGHCAYDTSAKIWFNNNNWIFVPGYSNGNAPYGVWPARRFTARQAWITSTDYNSDVAFVALSIVNQRHIQGYVGSQGIAFNQAHGAYTYSFGYPVNLDNGLYLESCLGVTSASKYTANGYQGQALSCNMGHGCSGGPWIQNGVASTGIGYVTSVNSFMISNYPNVINGPYFDSNIASLYNSATLM